MGLFGVRLTFQTFQGMVIEVGKHPTGSLRVISPFSIVEL
jgi:hypothetical protein